MTEGRSWDEIQTEEIWRMSGQLGAPTPSSMQQKLPIQARPGIAVYTASKLYYADQWRTLRTDWPEVHFTARWPWQHINDDGTPKWPSDAAHGAIFWEHDFQDIQRASVVLCYAEPEDILRGALVEAGMALGQGKLVITVGTNESFGTWQYHSRVLRVKDLSSARTLLRLLAL